MQLKLHVSMGVQCLLCGVYVMKATQPLEAIADYKVYEKGSKKTFEKDEHNANVKHSGTRAFVTEKLLFTFPITVTSKVTLTAFSLSICYLTLS